MSNNQDKIPEEIEKWIENMRPKDVDRDFTPAEVGNQFGYISGARAMYLHLSQQQGPRWVKASERMPPVGFVCGKCQGKPAVIENEMEGGNYLLADGNYVSPKFIEWLDESPSPVTSTQEEKGGDIMGKAIIMRNAYNNYIETLSAELFVLRGGRDRGIDHFKAQQDARNALSEALKPFIGMPAAPKVDREKERAIAFAKWVLKGGWEIPNSNYEYQDLWTDQGHRWPVELKTSDELYDLFLQSENK